jgi:hypothetical protein
MRVKWFLDPCQESVHILPDPAILSGGMVLTGMIPRVKSVGYLYLFELSVFFKTFCSVSVTSGTADSDGHARRHGMANWRVRIMM